MHNLVSVNSAAEASFGSGDTQMKLPRPAMLIRNEAFTALLILILSIVASPLKSSAQFPRLESQITIEPSQIGDISSDPIPAVDSRKTVLSSWNTDELTEEYFGAYLCTNAALDATRGNIFCINTTVNLWEHRMHLEIANHTPVCFFIYQGAQLTGTYHLVDSVYYDSLGVGEDFYSSGVRNFELRAGLYYLMGLSWIGHIQYSRGGPVPPVPCSFGSFQTGISSVFAGVPPAASIENNNTGIQAYHQCIVTGYPANPNAPWSPDSFEVSHNNAELRATLSWVNPSTTVGGHQLLQLSGVRIFRDSLSLTQVTNVQIGQPSVYQDTAFTEPGMHYYTLIPFNSAGDGLSVEDSAWIGLDTPGPPENMVSQSDTSGALVCTITWDPPTRSAHGGYWYYGAWDGIKIYRNNDEIADITGTATAFVDSPAVAGWYLYRVAYYNSTGIGERGTAPWVYAGYVPSGSFDIGGGNNNFPDLISAVRTINGIGVNGPVEFNVYPGIYDGQVTLSSIYYTSHINTVTFTGVPGPTGDLPVIMNTTGTGSDSGNGFLLRGVDYITIQGFDFRECDYSAIRARYGYSSSDSATHITIRNNYFNAQAAAYAQLYLYRNYDALVEGNEFNGATHGMRIRYSSDSRVVNNMFYGQERYGIYTYEVARSEYLFNSIYSPGSIEDSRTLYIAGPSSYTSMVKNNIVYNYGTTGVAAYYLEHPTESDYNCFYAPDCNVGYANFAPRQTMAEFRAATGLDAHSICADPLFRAAGDLHLEPLSPCVHAGIPIPDVLTDFDGEPRSGATPCIGCDETSLLQVNLTPHNPPVTIPLGGGSFRFDVEIINLADSATAFDAWSDVRFPNGMVFGPLVLRTGLVIPGNGSLQRTAGQYVPGVAPPGNYIYVIKVGDHPGFVEGFAEIPFEILAGEGASLGIEGWEVSGWFGDDVSMPASLPLDYSITGIHPNPFNAEARIEYTLPRAGRLKIAVYDINGRETAVLEDGWKEAGRHRIRFNGSSLSSGIYFCRMSAGAFSQTRKIVLLK